MLRHIRILWVLVAVVAYASGARAQEYSSVVVFGDSLSDSGNVAQVSGLPIGSSFTTNPDPVWAEIVARNFRSPGLNSLAGGSNYAFGGGGAQLCGSDSTPSGSRYATCRGLQPARRGHDTV